MSEKYEHIMKTLHIIVAKVSHIWPEAVWKSWKFKDNNLFFESHNFFANNEQNIHRISLNYSNSSVWTRTNSKASRQLKSRLTC